MKRVVDIGDPSALGASGVCTSCNQPLCCCVKTPEQVHAILGELEGEGDASAAIMDPSVAAQCFAIQKRTMIVSFTAGAVVGGLVGAGVGTAFGMWLAHREQGR